MIEHLDSHPHAIIKNGIVVWTGTFNEHDDSIFQDLLLMMQGDKVECCCNLGYMPGLGWHWDSVNQVYYQLPDEEMNPEIYYGWSPDLYGEQGYHEYILNRVV
jgi:hypothetical protein